MRLYSLETNKPNDDMKDAGFAPHCKNGPISLLELTTLMEFDSKEFDQITSLEVGLQWYCDGGRTCIVRES